MKIRIATLALVALFPQVAGATDVAQRPVLTLEGAKKAAAAAAEEAGKRNVPVVIAVVDDAGELLYMERSDGTQVGSIRVGIGKARTAAHFKRPTKFFEDQNQGGPPRDVGPRRLHTSRRRRPHSLGRQVRGGDWGER